MNTKYGILWVGVALLVFCAFVGTASATTWYVDDDGGTDFTNIQDAIDSATAGDTIFVRDGVYTENVNVNKRLTIRSENGCDNTIVQAVDPQTSDIFVVSANYVNISGFTVTGVFGIWPQHNPRGINLASVDHCNISNNNVSNNQHGILVESSNNNKLMNNIVSNNNYHGVTLHQSSNNMLKNNSILNNDWGIFIAHFLGGGESSNNMLMDNILSKNGICIYLFRCDNNILENNSISHNGIGVQLYSKANNNRIYLNNFINNGNNVYSILSTNFWNSPEKITYQYNSKTYTNYLGNYWDDYGGSDADNDGIGDTPFPIDGNDDIYPLMEPWANYSPADLTLSPDDITFSNPNPPETVTISATIHNIGNADASDVIVQFYSINEDGSKNLIGSDYTIDSISGRGGTGTAISDWIVTSDTQNIRVIIDPPLDSGGSIPEENEDNNMAGIINTGYRPPENGFCFSNYQYNLLPSWVPIELNMAAHCVGMSVTSLIYYYNDLLLLPEAEDDCNPCTGIPPCIQLYPFAVGWYPPCLTRCLIEYNQLLFYLDAARNNGMMQVLSHDWIGGKDGYVTLQFANLVSQLSSGPKMLILAGHSVVAYKVGYSSNQDLIYIYDPNYSGNYPYDRKIILDVSDSGLCHMNPYHSNQDFYDVFKVYEGPGEWFVSVPLSITATCPVNLRITDPEGFTVNKQSAEIPGTIYAETDINGDDYPDDIILIPNQKVGDYQITVIPEPDAEPSDTYTLEVFAGDTTIVLAEDVLISDIPSQPYIIRSTGKGIFIPATIDFDPDTLNLKSKGKWVTTYIELPEGHDVCNIDVSTVMLTDQVQVEDNPTEIGDYDYDGIADLMVKFDMSAVQEILEVGDEVEITVAGELSDGTPFEGSDMIRVIDE